MTDPSASQRLAEKTMKNDEKNDLNASLLPGDPLASPAKTEALPIRGRQCWKSSLPKVTFHGLRVCWCREVNWSPKALKLLRPQEKS